MTLNENAAHALGGKIMRERWVDAYLAEDQRDGDDIAADVMKGAGLRFKGVRHELAGN